MAAPFREAADLLERIDRCEETLPASALKLRERGALLVQANRRVRKNSAHDPKGRKSLAHKDAFS